MSKPGFDAEKSLYDHGEQYKNLKTQMYRANKRAIVPAEGIAHMPDRDRVTLPPVDFDDLPGPSPIIRPPPIMCCELGCSKYFWDASHTPRCIETYCKRTAPMGKC
jgi:hypothetical protein